MRIAPRRGIFFLFILPAMLQGHGSQSPLPFGFTQVGVPQRFGTPERKLTDGSIFDYMDGGGIVYLEHGFRELAHNEYANSGGTRIILDCFTMAGAAQALAALADEDIAPAGGASLPIAVPNKAHRFPPDYFIYMVQGRRLLYFHVNDDRLSATLDQFALEVLKFLAEEKNE